VREEVAFMQAVKVILTKRDITAKKRTDEQRDEAIRQIISNAVVSEQVVDIFDAVGLDKPNIGLLDDEFLAQVQNLPEKNLAVELLERLLEGEIKSRFGSNVVQEKKRILLLRLSCAPFMAQGAVHLSGNWLVYEEMQGTTSNNW
jgi:type I restriction enzyme R subunit